MRFYDLIYKRILKSTIMDYRLLFVLLKDYLMYASGSVLTSLGSIILIPLYMRHFSPQEFGVYALIDTAVLVMVTVTQLGLGVSYLKWFAELKEEHHGRILGSALMLGIIAASGGGGLLAATIASPLGERWLQILDRSFYWTVIPIVVVENVHAILLTHLRAGRKALGYSIAALVRLIVTSGASFLFIALWDRGIAGALIGRIIGSGAGVVATLVLIVSSLTCLRFSWPLATAMTGYGLPLVWSGLAWMAIEGMGRYSLAYYSTIDQVGLYSAAVKISSIFQVLVTQPFATAWGGIMFHVIKLPNVHTINSKIISCILAISVTVAALIHLFSYPLFAWLATPAYLPAMQIFPILLITRVIQNMIYLLSVSVYAEEDTSKGAYIWTVGLVANVLANIILTSRYGSTGASVAWLLGEVTIAVLLLVVARTRRLSMRIELSAIMFVVGIICTLLTLQTVLGNIQLSLLLIGGCVIFLYISLFKQRDATGRNEIGSN